MANMTTLVVTCVPNPDEQESMQGKGRWKGAMQVPIVARP